ncbi:hypothetical protein G6F22_018045 [Rhizopus arrhizus]|nr:hypothetical protein G6F22_018045 [Rhizopus arrhizus]
MEQMPPQAHSRRRARAAGQCRAPRRPPVHQRGAAHRGRPECTGAGEDRALDPWRDGRAALADRGSQGGAQGTGRAGTGSHPQRAAEAAAFRTGRPEHTDDRGCRWRQ